MESSTTLEATGYLSRGISVIPLNGKIPAIKWAGYQKSLATTDQAQSWWQDASKNIGIVTGDLSGFVVVDFDTEEAYEDAKRRGLPHGPTVKTGRGYHLYCQNEPGVRNFQKRADLPGIDLRAEGGYAVAPPSVHENGSTYEWLVRFDEATLPKIPDWLLAKVPEDKQPVKDLYRESTEGGRNNALARLVGSWVNDGGTLKEIQAQAVIWNQANNPPLPVQEVRQTVKSIFDIHKRNEKPQKQIKVVSIEQLLDHIFPPRENILTPWLPSQGVVMVYAGRGIGKTFFSLSVGLAVASGGPFLKWQAEKKKAVLLIDGEMPGGVLQERAAAFVAAQDLPPGDFRFITPDMQPNHQTIDLSRSEDQEAVEQYLDGVGLIIVDNISTVCRSGRENEGEGWLPVQEWALQQRAKGRSVMFIHHAGKGGNQRGTSRREDILDTVIALRRPAQYTPEMGAVFEIHFEKSRGIFGEDVEPIEATLIAGEDGSMTWSYRSVDVSTYDKVVCLLKEGLTPTEIGNELDINKSTASRHAKKARLNGDWNG